MSHHYDIVILGAGNAGFGVSQIAHAAGKSIAFVESDQFGGTCPNRGCTPKKVLVAAANALHEIERAGEHGIEVGSARLDWGKLIDRKSDMIDFIPGAMEETAKSRGDVYRGKARFVAADAIEVNGERIEAGNFVIATGSITRPLSIPGAEHLMTSDDVLNERELPDEVVFIGGGVTWSSVTFMPAPARGSRYSKWRRSCCHASTRMPWRRFAPTANVSALPSRPGSRWKRWKRQAIACRCILNTRASVSLSKAAGWSTVQAASPMSPI
jgi:hypothetical protein